METSNSIENISKSLKEFQSVAVNAFKGKKGYGYSYAPLDVILKENRPLMAKYGLSHIQSQEFDGTIVTVITRLIHESGEWIQTKAQSPYAELKGMNGYQSIGSGITYLRRYSLSAALGIASDEDEDAHGEQEEYKACNNTQIEMINKLITEKSVDIEKFKTAYSIFEISELSFQDAGKAILQLQKKK